MAESKQLVAAFLMNGKEIRNLSRHFSLSEFVHTNHGMKFIIENIKSLDNFSIMNLLRLSFVLEVIRRRFGDTPIRINSGFRSPNLNLAVNGASRSNHLFGCAADLSITPTEHLTAWFNHLKELGFLVEVIPYPTFYHIAIPQV